MKFFLTKKRFQRVLEDNKKELKKEFEQYKEDSEKVINSLERKSFDLLQENSKLKDSKLKQELSLKEEVKNLKLKIDAIKDDLVKANKSKGGLTKENNKLKKQVEECTKEINDLKAKINDLQSDRYLIKKIPSGRTKNTIKTKIKSSNKESSAIKYVKERL